eukprot:15425941-Alexandrium_andersonii.AAC.1
MEPFEAPLIALELSRATRSSPETSGIRRISLGRGFPELPRASRSVLELPKALLSSLELFVAPRSSGHADVLCGKSSPGRIWPALSTSWWASEVARSAVEGQSVVLRTGRCQHDWARLRGEGATGVCRWRLR